MSPLGVLTLAVIAVAIYDAVVLEPRRYTRAAPEPFADNGRPRGIAPAQRVQALEGALEQLLVAATENAGALATADAVNHAEALLAARGGREGT